MSRAPTDDTAISRSARLGGSIVALLHLACGVAWIESMAGGFPLLHRMSLANRWIPGALVFIGVAVLVAAIRGSARWSRRGVLALLGTWVGGGVAAQWVFPISSTPAWLLPGVLAAVGAWLVHVGPIHRGLVAMLPGALLGATMIWAQRSPAPGTRPLGGQVFPLETEGSCTWDGTVDFPMDDGVHVRANAMPRFHSVSPDRSWTALAPGRSWRGQTPECVGQRQSETSEYGIEARFSAEGSGALLVRGDETRSQVLLDATYALDAPVYSHLNQFFAASITGADVSVVMSPCPDHVVRPLSLGGPGQFAYLDADGSFAIAQTSSMEKGPFQEVCRAPLPEDGTIEFIVRKGERTVGRIVMRDWAAQADLGLSPTAGWGVPANAIELWRATPDDLLLSASLSATSIGSGWHSVGHRAGVYRNRVELRVGP